VPCFSQDQLLRWHRDPRTRDRVLRHVWRLADLNVALMDKMDLVRRTSESARLYGIDFYSVLVRGSQYRVEARLVYEAHRLGYLAVTPNKQEVYSQAAMEIIPLVMEPESRFYADPVVVLDFQALYPSLVIAYNLCFSTIAGKLEPEHDARTLGFLGPRSFHYSAARTAAALAAHPAGDDVPAHEQPYVSPTGSVFCADHVRRGILPQMLSEILNTRFMVKKEMKECAGDPGADVLRRVLDCRQLAIKLLANVTYGYTAASFSGRMPMAQLADAIVGTGRATLEWSRSFIEATWPGSKVVYGDTDSLFVHLPGRSKEEAFAIGKDIAREVTARQPSVVELKFEKVYLGCILQSKKRYVGHMFETVGQVAGHLDAKGIELVRRDQCGLVCKLQEKVLRLLFTTRDLSLVRAYLERQWAKILESGDKLTPRDFIFAKEVKFGKYVAGSNPLGAIVAQQTMAELGNRAQPPHRWRVPYVVVMTAGGGTRLKDLVVAPEVLLRRGSGLVLNAKYYIEKAVNPALHRLLALCGAPVALWYRATRHPARRLRLWDYKQFAPKPNATAAAAAAACVQDLVDASKAAQKAARAAAGGKQGTLDRFVVSGHCQICGSSPSPPLCDGCAADPAAATVALAARLGATRHAEEQLHEVCARCVGGQPHPQVPRGPT